MRVLLLCLLLFGFPACGGAGDPVASSTASPDSLDLAAGASSGPGAEIVALEIVPRFPTPQDAISADLQVRNAGREALEVEYSWYHNARLVQQGVESRLGPLELRRGDELRVTAEVRNAGSKLGARSARTEIQNGAPRVARVALDPVPPTAGSELNAVVYVEDPDGDDVELRYRWWRNGQELANASGRVLASGTLRRGDRVRASVSVRDEAGESNWVESSEETVSNSAPEIRSRPVYGPSESNRYEYQVVAEDPDGDRPLRYELTEGPTGMQVGAYSGRVQWEVPTTVSGEISVELAVIDPHGAESRQRYALRIDWDSRPASPR